MAIPEAFGPLYFTSQTQNVPPGNLPTLTQTGAFNASRVTLVGLIIDGIQTLAKNYPAPFDLTPFTVVMRFSTSNTKSPWRDGFVPIYGDIVANVADANGNLQFTTIPPFTYPNTLGQIYYWIGLFDAGNPTQLITSLPKPGQVSVS